MNQQKIVSLKNLVAVNKLLSNGWEFSYTVGKNAQFAILTKYRNRQETMGTLATTPNRG